LRVTGLEGLDGDLQHVIVLAGVYWFLIDEQPPLNGLVQILHQIVPGLRLRHAARKRRNLCPKAAALIRGHFMHHNLDLHAVSLPAHQRVRISRIRNERFLCTGPNRGPRLADFLALRLSVAVVRPVVSSEDLLIDDGLVRTVEFIPGQGGPIFAPLDDPEFFARVTLDHGTAAWPNGLDLDPVVLHGDREPVSASPLREVGAVAAAPPLTK
jgi:hypothetical protein